jgi:AcrR family transcriptional regulator
MQHTLPALRARERSGDHTRRRLFETAVAEFCRVGVEHASIGRIAATAGVSRPTFYFHFPTKDHVLLELQWSYEEPIAARIASAKTLDEAFAALVDGLVEALGALGHPAVFAEMVRIYTRHAAGEALADQPHHLMRAVAARFVEAHAVGRLRAGLDPARGTHLFLTSVFGYLSLPADVEESRRDLRTLTSLYLAEAADTDGKGPRR